MIKDLTNFVRPFVYGEPPFPVCADSLVCTNNYNATLGHF